MPQERTRNRAPADDGLLMAHLTEEQLGEYAFDPDALPDRREMEAHLADCPQCSSSLTCIRSIEFGLADPDAWEIAERDDSATREAMRNLAAQAAAEDEQAEHLLEKLLQNPARMAWTRFAKQGKYRTAGARTSRSSFAGLSASHPYFSSHPPKNHTKTFAAQATPFSTRALRHRPAAPGRGGVMRGVSVRWVAGWLLVFMLIAQGAAAEPRDRDRRWGSVIKHFIIKILDELGGPKP